MTRRTVIGALAALLFCWPIASAQGEIPIIPQPAEIKVGYGAFTLSPNTVIVASAPSLSAADPISWWSFGETDRGTAADRAGGHEDRVVGHVRYLPAVRGTGLKFDEFSTYIVRPAGTAPKVNPSAFTIEVVNWIAAMVVS